MTRVQTLNSICAGLEFITLATLRDTICTLGLIVDNYAETMVIILFFFSTVSD